VLHASGARTARAIAICIDDREAADRIVELAQHEFAQAKLMVRAFDRAHALKLVNAGVDVQVRETFESAVHFGAAVLRELDVSEEDADAIATQVRRLDAERFELETASNDTRAGIPLIIKNTNAPGPKPTPLTRPRRESKRLNDAAAAAPAPDAPLP
jgi:glutathione-regulated potassium-efflux system protein KefB